MLFRQQQHQANGDQKQPKNHQKQPKKIIKTAKKNHTKKMPLTGLSESETIDKSQNTASKKNQRKIIINICQFI